jgi:hypothetical protein
LHPNSPKLLIFVALSAAATGCADEIAHYRVPKESTPSFAAPAPPPGAGGATMASADVAPPPSPTGGGALAWTLPEGWTESRGGGMRFATLKPPVAGKVDVSVTLLAGEAGGELANVNRGRNQIGLPPLDAAGLAAARKPVRAQAGAISLYDFTSDGATRSRVVAGFTVVAGNTWFVKMTGDEGPVAAARPDFVRIVESLRRE